MGPTSGAPWPVANKRCVDISTTVAEAASSLHIEMDIPMFAHSGSDSVNPFAAALLEV